MDTINLTAKLREKTGKQVKGLREQKILPAVIYGRGFETQNLEVAYDEFEKIYEKAGENTVINLSIGNDIKNVLIYYATKDNIANKFTHIDFYQIRMDEKITANVPLVFEGEAPAVKALGGVLVKNIHEVEVSSLPAKMPHEIKVNLAKLRTFDDSIYVSDLAIEQGVEVANEAGTVVVSVVPPRSEAEMESLKSEVAEKVDDVKVETEEKKAAREMKQSEESEK